MEDNRVQLQNIVDKQNDTTARGLINKLIWVLTMILFASFFATNTNQYGSVILLGITMLVLGLFVLRSRGILRIAISAYHGFAILFALYCFVSVLWSRDGSLAVSKGVTIIEILICTSVFYWYFAQELSATALLKAIMWGGYLVVGYTFLEFGIEGIGAILQDASRIETDFANINGVAMVTAMALTIAVHFWIYEGFQISTVLMIPSVVALMASGSRTALVMAVVGVFLVIVFKIWSKHKVLALLKTGVFIIVAIAALRLIMQLPIFEGMALRMDSLVAQFTGEGEVDSSVERRGEFVALGWDLFSAHPIFGVGIDNARLYAEEVVGRKTYLHNNFLEMLAGGGILGFLIFYGIYGFLLVKLWRIRKKTDHIGKVMLVMLLVLLIGDYGTVSYYNKSTYFYFMFFFLYLEKQAKKENFTDGVKTDNSSSRPLYNR